MLVCPNARMSAQGSPAGADDARVVRDSNGNVLQDGDTVTVIKDLKVKGASSVIKVGTKVKIIRLVEAITTSTARSMALVPCS